MSRSRASAVFAALVTMVAILAGAATFTSAAASAAPPTNYPPVKPVLTVQRAGQTHVGSLIYIKGASYARGEKVTAIVYYPKQGRKWAWTRKITTYANGDGRFRFGLRLAGAGRVAIKATGASSRRSGTIYINVKKSGRNWDFRASSFATGVDSPGSAGLTPATLPADDRGLAIAGFGVLALLGSAVITRQVTRRRRKVFAA